MAQQGSLTVRNGKWCGRYMEYTHLATGELRKRYRRVVLGDTERLSEDQARQKLRYLAVCATEERRSHELGLVDPPEGDPSLLSPGDRSEVSKLIVATDLLARGYSVFRNVSSDEKVDLIALRLVKMYTVQVKTKATSAGACPSYPGGCDVLATVHGKAVSYSLLEKDDTVQAWLPTQEAA